MAQRKQARSEQPDRSDEESQPERPTGNDQTVYYLEGPDAEPVEAKPLNAPEDTPLTGYENLTLETKDGTHEAVPGEVAGAASDQPRWRLNE